jgi:hypothetical protein
LNKCLAAGLIRRYRLDEGTPVKPPICVKQRASFGDEVRVSEVERTIEIPEIRVAETVKKSERVSHRSL